MRHYEVTNMAQRLFEQWLSERIDSDRFPTEQHIRSKAQRIIQSVMILKEEIEKELEPLKVTEQIAAATEKAEKDAISSRN